MIRSLVKSGVKSATWRSLSIQVRSDRPQTYCCAFFQFKKRSISSLQSQTEARSSSSLFVKEVYSQGSTPSAAHTSRSTPRAASTSPDIINMSPILVNEADLHPAKPILRLTDGLGGVYEGEVCNGQMHGRGKHTYSNGVTYEGTFERGERHGKGIITDQFGAVSESHWQHGKQHGLCTILHANGKSFHGIYEYGKLVSGKGLLRSFQQGATFEGEWIAGKKQGHFMVTYNTGETFAGIYENNIAVSGVGTLKSRNGASMTGTWSNGRINGMGKLVYPDGSVYEGELVQNIKHGKGMWRSCRGARYSGSWENGKTHGKGVLTYPNGTTYTGEFQHGNKHGKGVITNKGKCIAKGVWVNDVKAPATIKGLRNNDPVNSIPVDTTNFAGTDGATVVIEVPANVTSIDTTDDKIQSVNAKPPNASPTDKSSDTGTELLSSNYTTITKVDGSVYQGTMLNKKYHGKGKLTYASGATLEGEFREGAIYNGRGVLYVRGAVFEGVWVEGKKHGTFSVTYPTGETFEGVYQNNKAFSGIGVVKSRDGTQLSGTWVDGSLHGSGRIIFPDGRMYQGELQSGIPHGGGECHCSTSNAHYSGTWEHGEKHGYGMLTHPDGSVYTGEFVKGKKHGAGRLSFESEHNVGVLPKNSTNSNNYYQGQFLHHHDGVYEGKWRRNMKQGYFAHTVGGVMYRVLFSNNLEVKRMPWKDSKPGNAATVEKTAAYDATANDVALRSTSHGVDININPVIPLDVPTKQSESTPSSPNNRTTKTPSAATTSPNSSLAATSVTYADGSVYRGDLVNKKYHGKGKLTYASGATLEGEFREGAIYNGRGTLYVQGAVFEGTWLEGKKHGEGKLTYPNKQTLRGEFKNGKMHNVRGVVYKSDGCKYEGAWVAGRSHGKFKITDSAGATREVIFNQGKQVPPK